MLMRHFSFLPCFVGIMLLNEKSEPILFLEKVGTDRILEVLRQHKKRSVFFNTFYFAMTREGAHKLQDLYSRPGMCTCTCTCMCICTCMCACACACCGACVCLCACAWVRVRGCVCVRVSLFKRASMHLFSDYAQAFLIAPIVFANIFSNALHLHQHIVFCSYFLCVIFFFCSSFF